MSQVGRQGHASPAKGAHVRVALVGVTVVGRQHAAHLADALGGRVVEGSSARVAVADAWPLADALVLCMATGAAIRLIAPHLADKGVDPAVVAIDDGARFAVALTGGHHGANDLARRVAVALGAQPVVTTASDVLGLPALDHLGAAFGLRLDPDLADTAAVGAALIAGNPVQLVRDRPWPVGPLPATVTTDPTDGPLIMVSDRLVDPRRPAVVYRPPSLVVGVGASRGAPAAEIGALVNEALRRGGLSPHSVHHLATVEAKAREPGLRDVAEARGWPLVSHLPSVLAAIEVPNPSPIVTAAVGTPSVAEAAALAEGGELLVPKRTLPGTNPATATVAVARRPVRGRLALISTGPGDAELIPSLAREALTAADLVVGLDQYVNRVRAFLHPGTTVLASPIGEEVARADQAVAAARAGRSVALVSGGDVGVYGMASPALERAGADVDVVVVPGITAATAAAALLGSPLGHDHCAISLSDLLTPWSVIRRRVQAAAEGDFVVSLYNPRSRDRHWQLGEALATLAEHRPPNTPVGVVTDAFRPSQRVTMATVAAFDAATVGMLSIVLVGNTQTRVIGGRMVTPRGYR